MIEVMYHRREILNDLLRLVEVDHIPFNRLVFHWLLHEVQLVV